MAVILWVLGGIAKKGKKREEILHSISSFKIVEGGKERRETGARFMRTL